MELELSSLLSPMAQNRALVWSPNEVSPNFKTRYLRSFESQRATSRHGHRPALLRVTSTVALAAAMARLGVVLQNSLE